MDPFSLIVVLFFVFILCVGVNYFMPRMGVTAPVTYIIWAIVALICLYLLFGAFGLGHATFPRFR